MLVGKPPFETSTLKETYVRITANKYLVPPHVSRPARNLITKLLAADPQNRPSLDKILNDEFFTSGHLPKNLPISCCETPPKFPMSPPSTSSSVSIPRSVNDSNLAGLWLSTKFMISSESRGLWLDSFLVYFMMFACLSQI